MQDAQNLEKILNEIARRVRNEVLFNLPRKVGVIAKNHFVQNFREGGFVDGGLHPWATTKRQQMGGSGADAKYSPLTSRRDHLMRSITAHPKSGEVTIMTDVPYANIHNEGGTFSVTITPKMKKYAWAKCYSLSGVKKSKKKAKRVKGQSKLPENLSPEASMWRSIALTKKSRMSIHIPQRKFLGDSKELQKKIDDLIIKTINKVTNGISDL